jgi:hypothetical protein
MLEEMTPLNIAPVDSAYAHVEKTLFTSAVDGNVTLIPSSWFKEIVASIMGSIKNSNWHTTVTKRHPLRSTSKQQWQQQPQPISA